MAQCTELIADASSAVVVKRATGVTAAARLRAEAERLVNAAHPGVVELLSSSGTDDRWELWLAHAGRPLDVVGAMSVAQVARLVAAAAATLADLHERGVVHGRVDASHVLIGEHGRPVLCGLGAAAPGSTPADDVAALGGLLAALLGSAPDMEPIPERRWLPRRSWSGWERRSLLLVADHAAADPPTRRPTARRMAAAIAEAVPGAAVATLAPASPVVTAPADASSPTDPMASLRATARTEVARPLPHLPALAGALVGVLALGAGALGLVRRDSPDPPPVPVVDESSAAIAAAVTAPTPTTTIELPPTTTTTVPSVPCVVLSGTTAASGACVEPVRIAGTTVLVGTHRFEIGQPGDVVVLGDWDCDGGATPAVLRPETGEVFVFSAWAAASGAVVVPRIARVPDATDLRVEPDADGCAVLLAERADGSRQPVAMERPA